VLDAIGGDVQKVCFDLMSPMGRLIVFGHAVYTPGFIYLVKINIL
jgi:hypothetical protein